MQVQVPAALLHHPGLSAAAKLLWIAAQHCPEPTPALLQTRTGLTRPTVLRGLTELQAANWHPPTPKQHPDIYLPAALLASPRLEPRYKLLYGIIQLAGRKATYAELSTKASLGLKAIRQAVTTLRAKGWIKTEQQNLHHPIQFTLLNPDAQRQEQALAAVRHRLKRARFKGEAIMREYLTLLVDSDEYSDDAYPGYLINPLTGRELQFDRYYPPGVAFEYNGAQHDGPTAKFPSKAQARRQRARDLMKKGLCAERRIHLIILRAADLTLERIRAELSDLLPLRSLDGQERTIRYLEAVSRRYREGARHGA